MGRASRAVVPVLLGLVGAGLGLLAGLAVHWFVVEPSDDELREIAATLNPAGFTIVGEPAVSGKWAPSFERGVIHFDATSPEPFTLGEVADGLRAGGWAVRGTVAPSDVRGRVVADRDGLVAEVFLLSSNPTERATMASVSLGRGPGGALFDVTVAAGTLVGAGVAVGAVLAARRVRSNRDARRVRAAPPTWEPDPW